MSDKDQDMNQDMNQERPPDKVSFVMNGLVQSPRMTTEQGAMVNRELAPFDPAVTYVFGSYGMPAFHRESDLDLAFLPRMAVDPFHLFQVANHLSGKLGIEVDLVDLTRASTVMRKEVLRTGQILHIHDERAMREFEMKTLSDYARLNEERHEVLAAI